MNDFSGQIFEILMRQAGIFYFNFFLSIIVDSLLCYFLVVYLLPNLCIDQTNTKCFPFQKKVFYIIWETNRTICPYITLQLIILSTVCTQVLETSWTEYGIFSDISHVNLSLMKHLSRHLLFTYSGLGFLQWRPTIYMLLK